VFGYNKSPNDDSPVSYAGCSSCKLLYLFVNMQYCVIQGFLYCGNPHKGKNRIKSITEKLWFTGTSAVPNKKYSHWSTNYEQQISFKE
jgi:hypothetical protein